MNVRIPLRCVLSIDLSCNADGHTVRLGRLESYDNLWSACSLPIIFVSLFPKTVKMWMKVHHTIDVSYERDLQEIRRWTFSAVSRWGAGEHY